MFPSWGFYHWVLERAFQHCEGGSRDKDKDRDACCGGSIFSSRNESYIWLVIMCLNLQQFMDVIIMSNPEMCISIILLVPATVIAYTMI